MTSSRQYLMSPNERIFWIWPHILALGYATGAFGTTIAVLVVVHSSVHGRALVARHMYWGKFSCVGFSFIAPYNMKELAISSHYLLYFSAAVVACCILFYVCSQVTLDTQETCIYSYIATTSAKIDAHFVTYLQYFVACTYTITSRTWGSLPLTLPCPPQIHKYIHPIQWCCNWLPCVNIGC